MTERVAYYINYKRQRFEFCEEFTVWYPRQSAQLWNS